MRILITGANGFLGDHLVRRLAETHSVTGVVRRKPDQPVHGVDYVIHDVVQPLDFDRFPDHIDAVIHQAALIDTDSLANGDAAAFDTNVVGTWRMLDYAVRAGGRRFVHASTGGVYGHSDEPLRETDPHNPMDLYALTKAQAELLVRHTTTPFPKVILRYFLPYGLGTPNPIPQFLSSALRGEEVIVADDGGPRLNPIHVRDAVEATVKALTISEDTTINIAGMETTTFRDMAEFACRRAGLVPRFAERSRDQLIRYYHKDLIGSTDRMQQQLSFTPEVPLLQGLSELVDELIAKGMSGASGKENIQ